MREQNTKGNEALRKSPLLNIHPRKVNRSGIHTWVLYVSLPIYWYYAGKQEMYLKHLPATEIKHFSFCTKRISQISTNFMTSINKDSELMWFWPVRIDMNWMITWKAQNLYPTHDTKADSSDRECWGFCVGMPGSIQVQYFPSINILIGSTIV